MDSEFLIGYFMLAKISVSYCVHCKSQLTNGMAQSSKYNRKSKYIYRRYNIVKHLLLNEIISIDYVKSKENIMDSLTKGCLSRKLMYNSSRRMSLKPLKDERVL